MRPKSAFFYIDEIKQVRSRMHSEPSARVLSNNDEGNLNSGGENGRRGGGREILNDNFKKIFLFERECSLIFIKGRGDSSR